MCEHNIKEKIEQLESDLQQIITEHNQLIDRKNVLLNADNDLCSLHLFASSMASLSFCKASVTRGYLLPNISAALTFAEPGA